MLKEARAFSSFAVPNLQEAKEFYSQTLGLEVSPVPRMHDLLEVHIAGSAPVLMYPSANHEPASFTILNFPVDNIEEVVENLTERGVQFEQYDEENIKTDKNGISHGEGMKVAWFKDPAGNILSLIEEDKV
jgi:predicted enzyme related to lactoylglutathione lyase